MVSASINFISAYLTLFLYLDSVESVDTCLLWDLKVEEAQIKPVTGISCFSFVSFKALHFD